MLTSSQLECDKHTSKELHEVGFLTSTFMDTDVVALHWCEHNSHSHLECSVRVVDNMYSLCIFEVSSYYWQWNFVLW